jgi:amino acid transporter
MATVTNEVVPSTSPVGPPGPRRRLEQVFHLRDLVSLSVSSVGPLFSIAATGGVMAANAGLWTVPAVVFIAVPFVISAFVFRLLNEHFPHAGASYHWSARILGRRASRFQAWIIILAYFASIPPIIIPAATYTFNLVLPGYHPGPLALLAMSAFWCGFALIPLLGGGRPTARLTQGFLAVELLSLVTLAVLGVARWHQIHVPLHFGRPPLGGMIVVAVVAATILDGWEIDSYASEEARKPRSDPGVGGIVGALLALLFYVILYPLILGETPLHLIAGAANPMSVWGSRLVPGAPWLVLIPVLASTAGGLWLTSFILTRALFAMGRERILPPALGKLSRRRVPHVAIVVTLGAALAVAGIQTAFSSLNAFFATVLASAGFFLVVEFFLDCTTAMVFLWRGHGRHPETGGGPVRRHLLLKVGSTLCSVMFAGLIVGFFVYGPRSIGRSIDVILVVLLAGGVAFALASGRDERTFVFQGDDLFGPGTTDQHVLEPATPVQIG